MAVVCSLTDLLPLQVERFPDLAAERVAWEKEQSAKRKAEATVGWGGLGWGGLGWAGSLRSER